MKLLGAVILSLIIIVVNAQFGLQLAIYEIFKPNIIETFCINKDIEGSDCEAMCMMSELAQKDADSQPHSSSKLEHEVQIKLFDQNCSLDIASEYFVIEKKLSEIIFYKDTKLLSIHLGVLSPPPQG